MSDKFNILTINVLIQEGKGRASCSFPGPVPQAASAQAALFAWRPVLFPGKRFLGKRISGKRSSKD